MHRLPLCLGFFGKATLLGFTLLHTAEGARFTFTGDVLPRRRRGEQRPREENGPCLDF